jgi:uncharacterized protein YlaI
MLNNNFDAKKTKNQPEHGLMCGEESSMFATLPPIF